MLPDLLTIGLMMLQLSSAEIYLRQLHDNNINVNDANSIQSSKGKFYQHEYIKDQKCDETGCNVEFQKDFTTLFKTGFGTNFVIDKMGLMNQTIEVGLSKVTYQVSLEYMYSTPLAKVFARWVSQNYKESYYNQCKEKKGIDGLISPDNILLSSLGSDWKFVASQSFLREYGAWSGNSAICGHHWLTTYHLCVEKALYMQSKRMLIAFRLTDEVTMDAEYYVKMGAVTKTKRYNGRLNEREVIEIDDNINIEVEPIGQIINPKSNTYIICDGIIEENKIKCVEWYYTKNMPNKGVIPQQGFGLYQLVNVKSPQKMLFNKLILNWDTGVHGCSDVKSFGSRFSKSVGAVDTFMHSIMNLYARTPQSQITYENTFNQYSLSMDSFNDAINDGDCCIDFTSTSDAYLDSCVDNFKKITDEIKELKKDFQQEIRINENGIPTFNEIELESLTVAQAGSRIVTKGLRLNYDMSEVNVENVKIPEMNYYENAAGSYFKFEMTYSGPSGNIMIKSKDITLLQEEYYIQSSGTIKDLIGFKSKGIMLMKPSICFGSNNKCVEPDIMNKLIPSSGSVDDPTNSSSNDFTNMTYDFFSLVFSNLWFALLTIGMLIVNIFLTVLFLNIFSRVIQKMFIALIAMCYCFGSTQSTMIDWSKYENINVKWGNKTSKVYDVSDSFAVDPGNLMNFFNSSSLIISTVNNKAIDVRQIKYGVNNIPCTEFGVYVTSRADSAESILYKYCVPDLIRQAQPDYSFALYTSNIKESFLNEQEIQKVRSRILNNEFKYVTTFKGNHSNYYWVSFSQTLQFNSYNNENYFVLIPYDKLLGRLTYIDHYFVGPGSNILILELAGETTIIDDNVFSYIDINFDIKGDYVINILKNHNKMISKHIVIIECTDKCIIQKKIVATPGTARTVDFRFNKRTIKSVRPNVEFNNLKRIIKENIFTLKGDEIKHDSKVTHWHVTEGKIEAKISNLRLKEMTKNIVGLSNDLSDLTDVDLKHFNIIEPRAFDINGIYPVSKNGPIHLSCEVYGDFAYCSDRKSRIYAIVKSHMTEKLVVESDRVISLNGHNYSMSMIKSQISMLPNTRHCSGELFIDAQSTLYCNYDCCLLSDTQWNEFKIIDPSKPFLVKSDHIGEILVSKYDTTGEHKYKLKSTNGCRTATFNDVWDCAWSEHAFMMWLVYYWPMIVLLFSIIVILTRIFMSAGKRFELKRAIAPFKNSIRKGVNLVAGSSNTEPKIVSRIRKSYYQKL